MTTRIWLRRGLGSFPFVALLSFVIWTTADNDPWHLEFDWGARYVACYVMGVAPLTAAVTAYDVGRRVRPNLALIGRTSPRGRMAILSPALAIMIWVTAGAALGWAVIWSITDLSHGIGPHDTWVFGESVAVLAASAAVGLAVGMFVDGLLSVAVSGGIVLLGAMLTSGLGPNLFQVATSHGTMVGIERTPDRAVATIAVHCGIVVSSLLAVWVLQSGRPVRRRAIAAMCLFSLAPLAITLGWPFTQSQYRPSTEAQTCVGSGVSLCGPASAIRVLRPAADDLAAARSRLTSSHLDLPNRFVIARGDAVTRLDPGTALLELDSSQMSDGHLPRAVLASTMAMPHLCPGLFSDETAPELLQRASIVSGWIAQALSRAGGPAVAPPDVQQAHESLQRCRVR